MIVRFLSLLMFVSIMQLDMANAQNNRADTEAQIAKKVKALLAKMTLDEKIGQMNQVNGNGAATGPVKANPNDVDLIKKGLVGSMLNVNGSANAYALQKIAVEQSRLGIPLIIGFDVIHGYKTIFPIPLGDAASFDLSSIENGARVAATEASVAGVSWTFAPMMDIARDARWGRIMEGAGEDPYYGSLVAAARVKGFQGKDLADKHSIAACAKHFAAYGGAEAGRDYNTVDISDRTLFEVYLRPFKAAADAGVCTFMNSFNDLGGVPATGNTLLVKQTLKNSWKFKGFVVSDWDSIGEMVIHGSAEDKKDAVYQGISNQCDMDMCTNGYVTELKGLVDEGKVSVSQIDDAVARILTVKYRLGLFDNPYKNCDTELEAKLTMQPSFLEAARDAARKSFVLLKNSNGVLPLDGRYKNIALIGPLADSKKDMLGTWTGMGDAKDAVTVFTGLKEQLPAGATLTYAKGCGFLGDDVSGFEEAISAAKNADVVVMTIGEAGNMSGEGLSRTDLIIPRKQVELLNEIAKLGKPVVAVTFSGRPLALGSIIEKANAILQVWFPGTMAGPAVADVLYGKYNPSGKLPVTFPRAVGQCPIYYNHKSTARPTGDPSYQYWSHYIDMPNTPLYPFGYGLSYTTFEYSAVKLSKPEMKMNEAQEVAVTVTNIGKVAGEEVVQLYVHDLKGSVTRPVRELKGINKVMLQPGESREVKFTLKANDLAFYTRDMSFKAEPGDFKVFVGGNSDTANEASFKLMEK
ncbi:glycoside hydrolase family 3 N-terminal domain-containing protein [uncultured Acetobacteroides sp.]|uniref:glycoside hydrolase family 3 N-terminal domain-containing protein n=1 Tax=uncultured Acetobacteroides sp. TaxID=1760811 RepID=UPI0029F4F317|nr:glycoside hydrolase family 3 N-terminal domain-containing protein [uncultured Acetobacteroides sp.]